MTAAASLVGKFLPGQKSGQLWEVLDVISTAPSHTPGYFSIGYRVKSPDGVEAFAKATDITLARMSADPVRALLNATAAHEFERSVLEYCQGSRLNKIVTAIDHGTISVDHEGFNDIVFFIIFELANGDLRKFVLTDDHTDLIWIISALHSFANAVNQLHSSDIYHNDLKPANALVFDDDEKIADLGRATSPRLSSLHEMNLCAGDLRFAPPEQLYANENEAAQIDRFLRFTAGDLYNLGSLMHFSITKRSLTPEIILKLDVEFRPPNQLGGCFDCYDAALPYWNLAFTSVMADFYIGLPAVWLERYAFALSEIKDIITSLCEPNFRSRGDLSESPISFHKYSLERIISRLDFLRKKLQVLSRA